MTRLRIAAIPGDGIGPEVSAAARQTLLAVAKRFGHTLEWQPYDAGGIAIDRNGEPLPQATVDGCLASDAVLLGAVGGPKWDGLPGDRRPEQALLGLRKALGLYANLRPAVLRTELAEACPLRADIAAGGFDMLIVRELTGGIYFGPRGRQSGPDGEAAYDTEVYSEPEVERIARVAFELAASRRGLLTSIDKANILESSRLWRAVVERMAAGYPSVTVDHLYVDNAAMQLIRRPASFDVVLAGNMFGDILSDEAAMLTGSIGLLPSASLGDPGKPGLYEPIHGSAPDLAGQDRANPLATILSAAMLLRHSFALEQEAVAVEQAVGAVLREGLRTSDLLAHGDTRQALGTQAMSAAVAQKIDAAADRL